MRFRSEAAMHQGRAAIRLVDDEAGLETVFLPGLGMVGASLRHGGAEMLGRTDNIERYASEGSTMGIPLLHPWANRLAGGGYVAAGRSASPDPSSPLLHADANGLPIHGVVGPRLPWTAVEHRAGEDGARLVAELDFSTPELLAIFPFPHTLRQSIALDPTGLVVETELTAAPDGPVPISFGYHPYLTVPGAARETWRIEIPPLRRLVLDGTSIPTGAEEPYAGLSGPLDRDYDDGFAGAGDGTTFAAEAADRRVELTLLHGYPYAQVFAPPGADYVCFEPMTAPTNALATGAGLRLADPSTTFSASFRIAVT